MRIYAKILNEIKKTFARFKYFLYFALNDLIKMRIYAKI